MFLFQNACLQPNRICEELKIPTFLAFPFTHNEQAYYDSFLF